MENYIKLREINYQWKRVDLAQCTTARKSIDENSYYWLLCKEQEGQTLGEGGIDFHMTCLKYSQSP
jgi:hypothetical protein